MLIYRVMHDDGSMRSYRAAMRQLDRVENRLRGLLRRYDQVVNHRILHTAIDRAVSKRMRLVTKWWKT